MVIVLPVTNRAAFGSVKSHSSLTTFSANLDAKVAAKSIKEGVDDPWDTTAIPGRPLSKDVTEVNADLRGALVVKAKAGRKPGGEVTEARELLRVESRKPPKVPKSSKPSKVEWPTIAGVNNKNKPRFFNSV